MSCVTMFGTVFESREQALVEKSRLLQQHSLSALPLPPVPELAALAAAIMHMVLLSLACVGTPVCLCKDAALGYAALSTGLGFYRKVRTLLQ